jgi:hypothetical protein
MKLEELVGKSITEAQFDEAAGKKDACYRKVKARYDVWPLLTSCLIKLSLCNRFTYQFL